MFRNSNYNKDTDKEHIGNLSKFFGFCLHKIKSIFFFIYITKKKIKNIFIIYHNKYNFDKINFYSDNLMGKFYFKTKFYYYNKLKNEETVVIDNKITRFNIDYLIKMNKQFIRLRLRRGKFVRGYKTFHYVTELQLAETLVFYFAKRNRLRWYALQIMFGDANLPFWSPSSRDEHIQYESLKYTERWRKPRRYTSYGILNNRESDLLNWLKYKVSKIFGFFYKKNDFDILNGDNAEKVYYESNSKFYRQQEKTYSELENDINNEFGLINKLEKFMLRWVNFKIKIEKNFSKEEIKEKQTERDLFFILKIYNMLNFMNYKNNNKFSDFNDYFVYNFLKADNKSENSFKFSDLYTQVKFYLNNIDKQWENLWTKKDVSYEYRKNDIPIIYLLVDNLIILKNDANFSTTKINQMIFDLFFSWNINFFEYLLLFTYLLFCIGLIISVFKLLYNSLINFDLEHFKFLFNWRNRYKKNKVYYNFYEFYNKNLSKFYKHKSNNNIQSLIFWKTLIDKFMKNDVKFSKTNELFLKWEKTKTTEFERKNQKELVDLNNYLNSYSMLTQVGLTKNFTHHLVTLIYKNKKKSNFWKHLTKILSLNKVKDYYVWDYFNQHIFDEMFFNTVLKEISFKTVLKNKKNTQKISDGFYLNNLDYNEFANIDLSKKNWFFRHDHNAFITKFQKTKPTENLYTRDWFRIRSNFFNLPTSKSREKLKIRDVFWNFNLKLFLDKLLYILKPISKNVWKIFIVILLSYTFIITKLWLTLFISAILFVLYFIFMISNFANLGSIRYMISKKKVILFFIKTIFWVLCICILIYIYINLYPYTLLYNVYGYDIFEYFKSINVKNIYTQLIAEHLKINELFLWIIKSLNVLDNKNTFAKFSGFSEAKILRKEFYFKPFNAWYERWFADDVLPYFKDWYYDIKIDRKDELKTESAYQRSKRIKAAFKKLSYIKHTTNIKALFSRFTPKEKFYKYIRNKYFEFTLAKAHLIMWAFTNYYEHLLKTNDLKNIYENYLYKHLQKTKFILNIPFMSEYKSKVYISKIRWFFYFNRKINEFLIYILLGMLVLLIILLSYFYTILRIYFSIISNYSIIKNQYYHTWLSYIYNTLLFNDNLIIKTMNNIKFIEKIRYFALKQQLKLLAETSKIKFIKK